MTYPSTVVMTSRQYMMCVTSVTPEWLAQLGGVFYSIRERNLDGLAQARATRDFSRKAEIEQGIADQRAQWVLSIIIPFCVLTLSNVELLERRRRKRERQRSLEHQSFWDQRRRLDGPQVLVRVLE
jgi:hypothetical protein